MRFCTICGSRLGDDDRFCMVCGEPVVPVPGPTLVTPETIPPDQPLEGNTEPELTLPEPPAPLPAAEAEAAPEAPREPPQPEPSGVSGQAEETAALTASAPQTGNGPQAEDAAGPADTAGAWLLKGFCVLCGAVLLYHAPGQLLAGLSKLMGLFSSYIRVMRIFAGALQLATGGCYLLCFLVLLLFVLRKNRAYTAPLFTGLAGGGLLACALLVLRTVMDLLFRLIGSYAMFESSLVGVLGCAVMVGGVYGILTVTGDSPALQGSISETLQQLSVAASEILRRFTAARRAAAEQTPCEGAYAGPFSPSAGAAERPGPAPAAAARVLKTDRSILMYVLLTLVTCGIYSLFFFHSLIQDVNEACAGDGDTTPGLLKMIVLSLLTCGIYQLYWYYKLGNRLQMNAPRYRMVFSENGTSVLLWFLVGALLCGIGPLVGLHILFKNTNALCLAYNRRMP